ncbi:hypothetical protein KBA41_10050 [Candidatus Ozemobacteraceae bacterium]|nr:hypothetical protein [Candidatus Ozemobacteraceae bacterium]
MEVDILAAEQLAEKIEDGVFPSNEKMRQRKLTRCDDTQRLRMGLGALARTGPVAVIEHSDFVAVVFPDKNIVGFAIATEIENFEESEAILGIIRLEELEVHPLRHPLPGFSSLSRQNEVDKGHQSEDKSQNYKKL